MKQLWLTLQILVWCALAGTASADAGTAILTWIANTETDLAGYKVYQSTTPGQYGDTPIATVGKVTSHGLSLPKLVGVDRRYYFTISAFDQSGNESTKSAEVSKLIAGLIAFKSVTDAAVVKWHLVNTSSPYSIYRNDTLVTGMAVDLRVRNGIAEVLGTETTARNWYKWTGTSWTLSITEPLPDVTPPIVPKGLIVAKATETEVIVVASAIDCPRILTSTVGSTSTMLKRTVRCVQG